MADDPTSEPRRRRWRRILWWVGSVTAAVAAFLLLRRVLGGRETSPAVVEAMRLKQTEGEIECGPFVDGVGDLGDPMPGRCEGDTCADACGCVCFRCSDDSGVCYGVCRELEGCEPLSQPPEFEVERVPVLVATPA